MDKKINILNKFETKLRENIQLIKKQNQIISESEDQLKDVVKEKQRAEQLYERQVEECRKLTDLLADIKCEKRIESEKQMICLREENKLNLSKIERHSQQMSQMKHDLNAIQSKCWTLERKLTEKESLIQKYNSFRTAIESEMTQTQTRFKSLTEEMRLLSENQKELKNIVKSANDINQELRTKLNKLNEELICVNRDNSSNKKLVIEWRNKFSKKEDELNDKDLKLLRLTQTNDLQKQENNDLRKLLDEFIREKESLKTNTAENNWNSKESFECDLNNETFTQTSVCTENNRMITD